jgi:hypothetical protein
MPTEEERAEMRVLDAKLDAIAAKGLSLLATMPFPGAVGYGLSRFYLASATLSHLALQNDLNVRTAALHESQVTLTCSHT